MKKQVCALLVSVGMLMASMPCASSTYGETISAADTLQAQPTLANDAVTQLDTADLLSEENFSFGYMIDYEAEEATITSVYGASGDIIIPESVEGYPVTKIGEDAFYGQTEITSVQCPSGLEEIGEGAFAWSSGLTAISFPSGLKRIGAGAFEKCTSLTAVSFPASVEEIDFYAFRNCSSLQQITFDSGSRLHAMGSSVFEWCSSLKEVTIPASITHLVDGCFFNCLALETVHFAEGSQLESLGSGCFGGTAIAEITLPDTLKTIGQQAFGGCENLTEITLPESLEVIEASAFSGSPLTAVTLPESLKVLGDSAFAQTSLTALTLPPNLTYIGSNLVYYSTVQTVVLPEHLPETYSLGSILSGCRDLSTVDTSQSADFSSGEDGVYSKDGKTLCLLMNSDSPHDITVKDGVEAIDSYAFSLYSQVVSIVLPDSVKKLHPDVCDGMVHLRSINIPDGVPEIPDGAFSWTNLAGIELPESVTRIGKYAFSDTWELANIALSPSLVEIDDGAFVNAGKHATPVTLDLSRLTNLTRIGDSAFASTRIRSAVLPENLTHIGNMAFYSCQLLTDVNLPEGLEYLGWSAFAKCEKLKSIALPDGVTCGVYDGPADYSPSECPKGYADTFYACFELETVTLPESMTEIPGTMFDACMALTEIQLPSGIQTLGNAAFASCTALASINLPEGLKTIGYQALYDCQSLTELRLPDSLETLGAYALHHCTSLERVYIPAKITALEDGIFSASQNLKEIQVSPDNPAYKTVDGVLFTKDMTTLYVYPAQKSDTEYHIPDTVTELSPDAFNWQQYLEKIHFSETPLFMGEGNFYNCSSLKEVHIPGHVTLGSGCFGNCENLEKVTLGEGISVIPEFCFSYNPKLTAITIPGSVEWIDRYAFSANATLTDITFIEGKPLQIAYRAFGADLLVDPGYQELVLPGTLTWLDEAYVSYHNYPALERLILLPGRLGIETEMRTLPEVPYAYVPASVTSFSPYFSASVEEGLVHAPAGSCAEQEIAFTGTGAEHYTSTLPEGIEPWYLALGLTLEDGTCSARAIHLGEDYSEGNRLILTAYQDGKMIAFDSCIPSEFNDMCTFQLQDLEGVTLRAMLLDTLWRPVLDAEVYEVML